MTDDARAKSRATWGEMAPGWERQREFMWRTTRHVADWLVEHLDARPGDTILDVAGGPGDNGFLATERIGPNGTLIETDFAPEMVDVARRRADRLGLANVETRVLDAERMDLADDSVDGIICRWGFMLMLDPRAALAECRRVLKEGRRLAFSVWGGPEKNPWVTMTGMTMVQLGHQPGGDPFGPGGMFSMSDPETVRTMVAGAGFDDVTIEEVPVDWTFSTFDEAWTFYTEVAGAIATVVKQLAPAQVDELRSALEEQAQAFRSDSGITLPGVTVNAAVS